MLLESEHSTSNTVIPSHMLLHEADLGFCQAFVGVDHFLAKGRDQQNQILGSILIPTQVRQLAICHHYSHYSPD